MTKPEQRTNALARTDDKHAEGELPEVRGLPAPEAKKVVKLMKLLSDVTRLRIVHVLYPDREMNVGTLCRVVEQSQPAVSHHLALLRKSGVLDRRREGKHNYYRLKRTGYGELVEMLAAGIR